MVDPLIELSIVFVGMNWMRAYGIVMMLDCLWWGDGIVVVWCGCERGAYRVMGVRWVWFRMECGLLWGFVLWGYWDACEKRGWKGSEWVALKGVLDRKMGWRWLLELKWRENGESCNDHLLLLRVVFSFITLLVLIVLSVVERGREERKKWKGCEGVLLLILNGLKGWRVHCVEEWVGVDFAEFT